MWCTNEWECWNVKILFSRCTIAFFHSNRSVVSSVEYMLKIRKRQRSSHFLRWVSPRLNVIPAPPRIVFIVLSPFEKSAWSIPVSRYLMRRITQFLQVMGPEQTLVCRFPLQSSNWSIIFSTILLTKELIFIYNYAYSSNYARGNRCHDSDLSPEAR